MATGLVFILDVIARMDANRNNLRLLNELGQIRRALLTFAGRLISALFFQYKFRQLANDIDRSFKIYKGQLNYPLSIILECIVCQFHRSLAMKVVDSGAR